MSNIQRSSSAEVIENFVAQIREDLEPWEKTAKKVRFRLENVKYQILIQAAGPLDLFDMEKNKIDGTVAYSGSGSFADTCSFNELGKMASHLSPADFPLPGEQTRKKAVRLKLELFNQEGMLIHDLKYALT